jgi:hypothetical protein
MKKIKSTILALAVCLTSLTTQAQTIKDFFVPATPKNKATFYTPDKSGKRTGMTKTIFYVDKGSSFEITTAPMFNGNPSSIITRTVSFTSNEVIMTSSVSTGLMETNVRRTHNPPAALLKLPPQGQSVNWSYKQISGDVLKCIASWITLNVDGKEFRTIKVEQEIEGLGAKTIEYYVQGIGLYKTDLKGSDGKVQAFETFDQLSYEQTAK